MEALDHIVINTIFDIDEAAALFTALGFHLTPLGRHSLGSLNHLLLVPGAYLELVGVPRTGKQRADILESQRGLNGLVLRSTDIEATFARLQAQGLEPSSPIDFSRPVEIDAASVEARFRTTKLPFAAGRVYFCQHLTPDYVWRPEWLTHPNGFAGFDRLRIASPAPDAEAERYARLCGSEAETTESGYRIAMTGLDLEVVPGETARFAELGLRFGDLDALADRASRLDAVTWRPDGGGSGLLEIPSLDLRLECRKTE